MFLLLAGLNLSSLPMILLVVLAILYWILSLFPPFAPYASKAVLIVGGIIVLLFLISLIGGGSVFGLQRFPIKG